MQAPHEIISDEEIIRVHGHSNFGDMSPREVVNDGVRKYAIGYTGGHTQLCILMEHGLITKPKPGKYSANLTQKGKSYARAVSAPRTDISQAAVAAALEAAARVAEYLRDVSGRNQDGDFYVGEEAACFAGSVANEIASEIRALITQPQHDALAAHVAAEVERETKTWKQAFSAQSAKLSAALSYGDAAVRNAVKAISREIDNAEAKDFVTHMKIAVAAEVAKARAEDAVVRDAASQVLHDIDYLVANSQGVIGLHQNGNIAEWSDILEGGSFETWLMSVETLRTALSQIGAKP